MEFVYKARIADRILERRLAGKGAVLIEGPKWCGKTTTAEQRARSILYMDRPEDLEGNLRMADLNPRMLLAGESPRLIVLRRTTDTVPDCSFSQVLLFRPTRTRLGIPERDASGG